MNRHNCPQPIFISDKKGRPDVPGGLVEIDLAATP
jgi:hypothetical protein